MEIMWTDIIYVLGDQHSERCGLSVEKHTQNASVGLKTVFFVETKVT